MQEIAGSINRDLRRLVGDQRHRGAEQKRNKEVLQGVLRESDCNIAAYGNMLIYYDDVRNFYRKHGYKTAERLSDRALWEIYRRQVGYVARLIAGDRL